MQETIQFLIQHGALVVFAVILLDEIGLPMPAEPFLLGAGALAVKHQLSPFTALGVALLACMIADTVWFYLGRYGGTRTLRLLCRIALEPDSCVRRTRSMFERFGMRAVLVAKFMPGLSAVVPPMAGSSGISFVRYLAFDVIGSLLYIGSYMVLGALFSNQLETILAAIAGLGKSSFTLLGAIAAVWLIFKYTQRQRLLRELRAARITVDELRRKQELGEPLEILDLRSRLELEKDPSLIMGALHIAPDEIEARHAEIPRDRDIVLYCSCPNEVTSARVASLLRTKGIERVRPLLGGIDAWRERNFPMGEASIRPITQNVARYDSRQFSQ
jgi:membrane protein DedA with SNARE-associated domain/rhodanese-related sulfurtransferase